MTNAQNKTFRFEARTPNGKWFIAARNVSAVEADAYAKKYLNDPDVRVVPETAALHPFRRSPSKD